MTNPSPDGRVPMLSVRGLSKSFGGVPANDDVSFDVSHGSIVGLIGPNGAGKTTLFNCIAGYLRPDRGDIFVDGRATTRMKPHQLCDAGVVRTWQLVRVFGRMTVLENVMCGAFHNLASRHAAGRFANRVLDFVGLEVSRDTLAEALPLGERKRLEIARALATGPRLLLLDEAMSGLTPAETMRAVELVRRINVDFRRELLDDRTPLTICIVEHVMEVIMPLSHHIFVINGGRLIAEGQPSDVVANPEVVEAYLGESFAARRH